MATRQRRRRSIKKKADPGTANDWPAIAEIARTGAHHAAIADQLLSPTGLMRKARAAESILTPETSRPWPPLRIADASLARPTQAARETLDAKLVRMIGPHKQVLLDGDALDAVASDLAGAGCHVFTAPARVDGRVAQASGRVARDMNGHRRPIRIHYDVVAVRGLLEYVADPIDLLVTTRQQLTDDGYVVAVIPNLTHGSIRLRILAGQAPAEWGVSGRAPVRFFDVQSITRLFDQAGFTIARIERHVEAFDAVAARFSTALPPQFVSDLTQDADAMTASFLVMAYAGPLNTRTSLELRVRELAEAQEQQGRALEDVRKTIGQPVQHERIESLDQRLHALSAQVVDVTGQIDEWRDRIQLAPQPALRTTRDAIASRISELAATARNLQRLGYEQLVRRVRAMAATALPAGSIVLVVSKGDGQLVDFPHHVGWHFLQTAEGVYAGHHPANSAAAIDALERMRRKGAAYLVFPHTAFWWFDHYAELKRYLDVHFHVVARDERTSVIYGLTRRSRRS